MIYQPATGCSDCLEQQPDEGVLYEHLCAQHLADLIAGGIDE